MNFKGGAIWLAVLLALAGPAPAHGQFEVLTPREDRDAGPLADEEEAPEAAASPCGTDEFTIAELAWPSAAILAHIHATILRVEFDCAVRLVMGEPAATLSSMTTTRQPALAPELWISRHPDIWNGAMRAQSARAAAATFSGEPLEGWFVPAYVREETPRLAAVTDLEDHWQIFAGDGASRARLISCPPEWACALINRGLLSALGLDEHFTIFEPEDRFAMDQAITDAVAQRQPVLTYYWQPNGLIDRLGLVPLEMGAFDHGAAQCMALENCVPFGPSSFAPDTVVIAVAEWVFADAPEVAAYLERASMPLAEMNRLLAWQAEHEASPEAVAQHFLLTGREIWHGWVGTREAQGPEEDAVAVGAEADLTGR